MDKAHTVDSTQPAPTQAEIDIQFSNWLEKMQAHCSSHHTAGIFETPAPLPNTVDPEELRNEVEQR